MLICVKCVYFTVQLICEKQILLLYDCYNFNVLQGDFDGKHDSENPGTEQVDKIVQGQVNDVKVMLLFIQYVYLYMCFFCRF